MGAYGNVKDAYNTATSPLVLGGWLLVPFFGATANIAHAANDNAGFAENMEAFYGPVAADPVGAVQGFFTNFIPDAAVATTNLGGNILSGVGVNAASATAGAGSVTAASASGAAVAGSAALGTAFSFATGAAVAGLAIWGAAKAIEGIESALNGGGPQAQAA